MNRVVAIIGVLVVIVGGFLLYQYVINAPAPALPGQTPAELELEGVKDIPQSDGKLPTLQIDTVIAYSPAELEEAKSKVNAFSPRFPENAKLKEVYLSMFDAVEAYHTLQTALENPNLENSDFCPYISQHENANALYNTFADKVIAFSEKVEEMRRTYPSYSETVDLPEMQTAIREVQAEKTNQNEIFEVLKQECA